MSNNLEFMKEHNCRHLKNCKFASVVKYQYSDDKKGWYIQFGNVLHGIKYCPFCGSENVRPIHFDGQWGYSSSEDYVTCRSCGTNGPIVKDHNCGNNIERAIEKWNHREN